MKKFLFLLMTLALIVMPMLAMAEGETAAIPTEPFTWAQLASIAGATAFVLLVVQFLKVPLDRVWRVPTRVFTYILSLAVMLVATGFTVGLTVENACMAAVNAFIVALSAYGAYELTFKKLGA